MSRQKRNDDLDVRPSVIGNYRVLKKIGEGSFGIIYEGILYIKIVGLCISNNEAVAIKFVNLNFKF